MQQTRWPIESQKVLAQERFTHGRTNLKFFRFKIFAFNIQSVQIDKHSSISGSASVFLVADFDGPVFTQLD